MGYVLIFALSAFNATNMFAAIITLSLVGIVLVYAAQAVERRLLHWSPEFR
jgi:NitT/TauT family transport system permease protein